MILFFRRYFLFVLPLYYGIPTLWCAALCPGDTLTAQTPCFPEDSDGGNFFEISGLVHDVPETGVVLHFLSKDRDFWDEVDKNAQGGGGVTQEAAPRPQKPAPRPQKPPRKCMSVTERAQQLLQRLRRSSLCFEDVCGAYSNRGGFEHDVLRLMHTGIDIREEQGRYHYYGKVKDRTCPHENVAVAMFKLLCDEKLSLFQVSFQLYRDGYIAHAPEALKILEHALAVGDVHPHNRSFISHDGVDFCVILRDFWKNVEGCSAEDIEEKMRRPSEKYACVLQHGVYTRVIRRLCALRDEKTLCQLQQLKYAKALDHQDHGGEMAEQGDVRVHRRDKVLRVLQQNINAEVHLDDLLKAVNVMRKDVCGDPTPVNMRALLGVVISLAMRGWPIIYDKEKRTAKLLDTVLQVDTPKENTNLLTLLYDLIQVYNADLVRDEIAYYAYCGGYWPSGFKGGEKRRFFKTVNKYKELLAIMGHISVDCCVQYRRGSVTTQRLLWLHGKTESAVDKTNEPDLSLEEEENGVGSARAVKVFQASPEFAVFLDHLLALGVTPKKNEQESTAIELVASPATKEAMIENALRREDLSTGAFWSLCSQLGFQKQKDVWDIAGVLTLKKEGGRLLYNPEASLFSWDDTSCLPEPKKNTFVSAVFVLKRNDPDLSQLALLHMLRQQGFQDVQPNCITWASRALAVLGFCPTRSVDLINARKHLALMLAPYARPIPEVDSRKRVVFAWKIAEKVNTFVQDGSVHKLWKVYQEGQGERLPCRKRQKLDQKPSGPEHIMRLEIPHLYNMLQEKRTSC